MPMQRKSKNKKKVYTSLESPQVQRSLCSVSMSGSSKNNKFWWNTILHSFMGIVVGDGAPAKTATSLKILKNQKPFSGHSSCYID